MKREFPITEKALRWIENFLAERFGYEWSLLLGESALRLELYGGEGAIIFDTFEQKFFNPNLDQPCTEWQPQREGFVSVLGSPLPAPGVARLPTALVEKVGAVTYVHYDILGLTYWMLTRIEEIGRTDLDSHKRFPATSSHAYKHKYLARPVVDEWLHVLAQVIVRQWEGLALRKPKPKTFVTCDLDSPYEARVNLVNLPRKLAGDLLKQRSVGLAMGSIARAFRNLEPSSANDSHLAAIDWMMDVNERAGNRVAFYFITDRNHPLDAHYRMDEPVNRRLLQRIHDRGHEIGLHPSYTSYSDPERTAKEANILRSAMEAEGIHQPEIGGRQHFLRWSSPLTAGNWEAAGMQYDSTLAYADHAGFRCGTCHEFQMFDPTQDRALNLRQRPLVLMECSVIEDRYMGLGYSDEAIAVMHGFKDTCEKMGGAFTLLWHNSRLTHKWDKELYGQLVGS